MADRLYEAMQGYLLSYPDQNERVLMLRVDEAPVKRIRGLYRYHVLLKLFDHPDAQPVLRFLSELSLANNEHCHVFDEINPTSMM